MQVVFAGKAHPADRPGQGVIQDIFSRSRSAKLRGRVFILEDYDIRIARFLVQGVDVWLNNPRRPLEASGTSGMKAAANGVLNMSVLDGWWDEGWTGDNGWAIGSRETNPDEGAQDWADAQDLYRILEQELIPAYYERDADGLPARWAQLMRNSIASTIWRFSTTRMLHEYVERLYLPAAARDGRAAPPPDPSSDPGTPLPTAITEDGTVAPRISLALAIHNHQPVGNFGWVFAEVYDRAYLPMLEALERHPGVRLSLHYTGPLLEWLAAERPEFLARLGVLVARDQVELLGGGLYEPILASLPEQDRVDQLTRMASTIQRPHGPPAAGRLARGAGLGAGPADVAGPGRVSLDHPRRPALPGRRDPRGEPLGRLHDRGPGQPAHGLRHRAGPPLPDPVRDRGGRDRLPPRARDGGRQARGHDGRRRREVRRLAHHVRALLGRAAAGWSGSSRRSRPTRTG